MVRTTAAGLSIARASSIHRLLRVLLLGLPRLPFVSAIPLLHIREEPPELPKSPDDPSLYVLLSTAVALVLLGGIFAGLTIALMGQDEIYLQVIATSGEGKQREQARKVLKLLKTGKHWILVTLLLSNVITNETLPVILDRSIGGGWQAVLSSTVLIVIFGEVIPQSICVRYGLPIGAWTSKGVLCLMWITAPVAWPIAKLLDYLLGNSHATTYKKEGLKTLVTLHRTLGTSPDERLNKDEVTIISAVLDLKEKSVGSIMTPIDDVFTLSADAVLDEELMDTILTAGYSRIPIYTPDHPQNFVGMLLVKMLITYDPEDCLRVRDFSLATLPESRPETSCLDIVNFFQEGKSHMVLVSDYPGEPYGALGVVTLEDVIEELIGEEIIDESDVFVDVHKAIRRMHPAPRTRVPKGEVVIAPEPGTHTKQEDDMPPEDDTQLPLAKHPSLLNGLSDENGLTERGKSLSDLARSPTLYLRRRRSADVNETLTFPVASGSAEVLEALKHLGPSNLASAPKSTKINTVHIKPGSQVHSTREDDSSFSSPHYILAAEPATASPADTPRRPSPAGLAASDASKALTQARQAGYGTLPKSPLRNADSASKANGNGKEPAEHEQGDGDRRPLKRFKQSSAKRSNSSLSSVSDGSGKIIVPSERPPSRQSDDISPMENVGSSGANDDSPPARKQPPAHTGSITESVVDSGGLKKLVLGLQPPESDNEGSVKVEASSSKQKKPARSQDDAAETVSQATSEDKAKAKKRRKKRSNKKKGKGGSSDETQPLLPQ